MTTLTVTAKGQVTLKKDLLQHLGVKPGDRIEVEVMPGGRLKFAAAKEKTGSWEEFFGILAGQTDKVATIEEMNEAIARGWAGLDEDHSGHQSSGEDGNAGRRSAGRPRNARGNRR